jgi:hypothetical protein
MNTTETTPGTLDISKLSAADLKAELERREKEEKQLQVAARNNFEADKNNFTRHTSSKFLQLQQELKELKEYTITEANKLYNRMYEINGKDPKETNSFSLKNSDDTVKVTVERQERFEFTEEAGVHINAIKEIFKHKFEARHKGMYNLLDGLLIKSKGEYDPKLLAKARRQVRELGDEGLIEEFDKLDDCQRVTGTALYCRLYTKDAKGKWEDVSLQFSSL